MNLFYRTEGAGPPLIILHGLFGSADNWATIAKKLSARRKIYLVDQRNHGKSPHSNEFNYAAMVDDLYFFIKQHDILRPDILGHSMGGKVAMFFAIKYPDKINRLIVVDIGPKQYPIHHDVILEGLKDIDVGRLQSRKEADVQLANYVEYESTRQFLLKNLKRTANGFEWKMNLAVIYKQVANVGEGLSVDDSFTHDTIFIRGSKSSYILDEDLAGIRQHFPNSSLETISDANHWVHAEQPIALVNTIENFLG